MGSTTMEISIPSDNEGYVLLQCPICGDYFKLKPHDYEDEGVLDIHCPYCGIIGESYLTQDVIDLAKVMIENYMNDIIHQELKKIERQFSSGIVSFKVDKKSKPKIENPIVSGIDALAITKFNCCSRTAKIKPMIIFTGCYCPFCGVKNYELN